VLRAGAPDDRALVHTTGLAASHRLISYTRLQFDAAVQEFDAVIRDLGKHPALADTTNLPTVPGKPD